MRTRPNRPFRTLLQGVKPKRWVSVNTTSQRWCTGLLLDLLKQVQREREEERISSRDHLEVRRQKAGFRCSLEQAAKYAAWVQDRLAAQVRRRAEEAAMAMSRLRPTADPDTIREQAEACWREHGGSPQWEDREEKARQVRAAWGYASVADPFRKSLLRNRQEPTMAPVEEETEEDQEVRVRGACVPTTDRGTNRLRRRAPRGFQHRKPHKS